MPSHLSSNAHSGPTGTDPAVASIGATRSGPSPRGDGADAEGAGTHPVYQRSPVGSRGSARPAPAARSASSAGHLAASRSATAADRAAQAALGHPHRMPDLDATTRRRRKRLADE